MSTLPFTYTIFAAQGISILQVAIFENIFLSFPALFTAVHLREVFSQVQQMAVALAAYVTNVFLQLTFDHVFLQDPNVEKHATTEGAVHYVACPNVCNIRVVIYRGDTPMM